MKYMLDTDMCIYYINKKSTYIAQRVNEHIAEGVCISAITLAELEHGVSASTYPEKNSYALNRFLAVIDVLEFDDEAAALYGKIRADLQRKGQLIGPLDMLIAAHALAKEQILVTNNTREFERVKRLNIVNWVSE